ncbi:MULTISPECIES: hypothetical protein [unclassified Halomonas]|uniref:hypothetical protein n=1 Tax=unclassified Halomonas TaxID=2609666 RepID=UPI000483F6B6|nr:MULTISPECIES: hypothetical protein [unclassified Halomonas]PKH59415.1 hypothetical protein CXF94_17115 [Halomonas sp. Choline-3u-9]QGQ70633.1 hypothetical protein FDY98_12640 [Halomonas sp. PA16-9]
MNETFEDYIADKGLNDNDLAQAALYYLSERYGDPTATEMREKLYKATGNPNAVDAGLDRLTQEPLALDAASHSVLAWAWDQPEEAIRVERAVDAAKQKLPVIEVGLLSLVAMYGMYLVETGNLKRKTTKVTLPDGTKVEKVEEYYPPSLSNLTALFKVENDPEP